MCSAQGRIGTRIRLQVRERYVQQGMPWWGGGAKRVERARKPTRTTKHAFKLDCGHVNKKHRRAGVALKAAIAEPQVNQTIIIFPFR